MAAFDASGINWGTGSPNMDLSQLSGYQGMNTPQQGAAPAGGFMGFTLPSWLGGPSTQNSPATALTPGAGAGGTNGLGAGFGMNVGTGQLALGGLQTLGNLWSAWNANKLAGQEFNFQKGLATTNLNNSVQSYNTNLEGQANARYYQENNPGGAAAYVDSHKLNTGSIG
jgi:hypothetical protein